MDREWLMWGSIGFGTAAAVIALYATTYKIRDQIDFFMSDINAQGYWAAWAAWAAGFAAIGVLLQALHYFMTR